MVWRKRSQPWKYRSYNSPNLADISTLSSIPNDWEEAMTVVHIPHQFHFAMDYFSDFTYPSVRFLRSADLSSNFFLLRSGFKYWFDDTATILL